jgi:hypothetical protein
MLTGQRRGDWSSAGDRHSSPMARGAQDARIWLFRTVPSQAKCCQNLINGKVTSRMTAFDPKRTFRLGKSSLIRGQVRPSKESLRHESD